MILKTFKNISLEPDIRLKIDRNIRDIGCEMDITISIHVRRGDYVKLSKIHPVQDESYYRRGLLAISNKLNIEFEILLRNILECVHKHCIHSHANLFQGIRKLKGRI